MIHPEFIVDKKGTKKKVVLTVKEFDQIMDQLDELDAIKAYDKAVSSNEEAIPFDLAIKEIESRR